MIDPNLIDFQSIFTVFKSVDGLKEQQMRMLRTTVMELAIEKYSGGQLKYVGDVENGKDFIGVHDGLRYESKSLTKLFQETTGLTHDIILKNFHSKTGSTPEQTFDYLLVWDSTNMIAGIADWKAANKRLQVNGANVKIRLEEADIQILSSGIVVGEVEDFKQKLMQLIRASI